MRIGGLASGMDIDQIVSDLMKAERMKVDKLQQQRQLLEWQQEDYRAINLALRSFRDKEAFDMRMQSTFLARKATSTNESIVTATGGVNAVEGLHSIEVKELARGASITGTIIDSADDKSTIAKQFPAASKNEKLIINGVEFKVNSETDSIYSLVNRINNNSYAGVSLHTTQQAVNPVDEEEATAEEKAGVAQIQTLQLTKDAMVEGLTIDLAGKKVVLYDSGKLDTEAAQKKYGEDTLLVDIKEAAALAKAELEEQNLDETAIAEKIADRTALKVMESISELSIEKVNLSFKNNEITIESKEPGTANAVSAKITGGKAWNVRASYDETLDRFFLTTNKTGSSQQINVTNTDLSNLLKITTKGGASSTGQNAKVIIDDLEITSYESNQFTLNNITYNLHNTSPAGEKTTVSVTQDSEAIFDSVNNFVKKYNEIVELIEKKLEEVRYKDYTWPLSDDDRQSLTDDQIDLWKEKSRSGILRNDTTLREIRDQLRFGVTQLTKIGVKTTGDYFTAKLEVDEDALRKAIQEDARAVMNLFSENGEGSSKGAARRVTDALSNGINQIIDKAGSSGSRIDDESYIGKRIDNINDDIDRWDDRLKQIEDRYWRQFTAMEKAINQMNQQSAWLAQQFGGGM
jgi:flagellar hook-associated protein 2